MLQRALKVYTGVKPLLLFLTTFPILPQTWRTGITVLTQVLDALAAGLPGRSRRSSRAWRSTAVRTDCG